MAIRSGFFNSINDDRLYSATEFAEYFATFIGNGVFPTPLNGLQVVPDDGNTILIKAGKAWINGYYFVSDADVSLSISPDVLLPRTDRIVLRLHFIGRQITLEHKQGVPASSPGAPALTRNAEMIELSLATISLPASGSSITSGMITDTRANVSECGFVASTITNIPTLTFNRALVSNSSGELSVSEITSTQLGHLSGVSSNIQTQINGKQTTISGGASTIASSNLTTSRALQSDGSGKVAVSSVSSTELSYLSGVTSSLQSQINGKQATVTGAGTTLTSTNLTTNRALVSDANGKVAVATITSTELATLSGVSSAIQTQLNAKLGSTAQAADSAKIGGRKIHVGTSAPSGPVNGDLWVDTN
jgi:hypothetical protein